MSEDKIKVPEHLLGKDVYTSKGKLTITKDTSQKDLLMLQKLGTLEPPKRMRTVQISKPEETNS